MLGGVAIEELEIRGQEMVFKDSRQPGIKISQVIKGCAEKKRQLSGHGWFKVPSMDWNAETGRGKAYMTYAWATNIAEVEVNTQSGEVKVIKVIAAHDVGKAINPDQVEAQIQGGTVQGAGYGTMEEILHNPAGEMQNTNFSTYIIPSSLDAPQVEPLIVESAFEQGPYGAKGFGEQPLMGVAPAITNAIYHATGVRLTTIPATPERMLAALANLNEE